MTDGPNEGFNDPTQVAPVSGNPATSLGQQRRNAALAAARVWAAILNSNVPIIVDISMQTLICSTTRGVLADARTGAVYRNFPNAPRTRTWYSAALADSLAGSNLSIRGTDPTAADIEVRFNSGVDDATPGCLDDRSWWYGIGAFGPRSSYSFVDTALHEIAHGLGFSTFMNRETGAKLMNGDDAFMLNLEDHSSGRQWPMMSDAERLASGADTGDLHWTGQHAVAVAGAPGGGILLGVHPSGHIPMHAPSPLITGSSITHWAATLSRNGVDELMESGLVLGGISADIVTTPLLADIGWSLLLPDLTVGMVGVSESSVVTGTSFTINATVRNSGHAASAATTLRYYRSTDNRITTADTALGTDPVRGLTPGANSPENASVSINNTGTWWVGACVASVNNEAARGNNCSAGVQVNVVAPTAPDLTVDTVSVSDSSVVTGTSFTINATVRNSGDAAAAATTLRYVRSDDATITSDDTELTTDNVVALAANGSSSKSTSVSITATGTWWVGACVATVSGESDTDNNCSDGVQVAVTVPAVPDLAVDTVSISQSSVVSGTSFTINATVRNSGNAASAATTLHYYRSDDATITADDTELTTDNVSVLASGANSPENASVSITEPGGWWVGACVDMVSGETATDNNCSTGVQVTITAPDLIVQNVSVSDSSVETGDSFTINATVRNSGDAASAATTLRYYRSTDNTITSDDMQLETDPVVTLAPGADSPESASVSIADADTWWVGACAANVSGESETDNNCSTGVEVTVVAPTAPDLTVDTVSVSQSSVVTGTSFTINATVRNSGTAASAATTLHYYRSEDATITADDTELTTDNVSVLAAGANSPENASVSITDPGTWWVGACVDRVSDENTTDNNCSTGVQVTITAPDLIVQNVSVSDSSVETGESFTINATVRNSGDAASAATTLRYYRSTDNTITSDDTLLGTDLVGALVSGANSPESTTVSITATGNYWVGACVATVSGESVTGNNCSSGAQVAVAVPTAPDLIVDTVSVSQSSVVTGTSFTINATVRNPGTAASATTTLHYYLSEDATITADDTELTTDSVSVLASGANSPENASVSITDAGRYWVGACVDRVSGETATSNNCSTGVQVTVTLPTVPDLLVDTVTVTDSTPEPGDSFTINATVRNPGTAASAATTLRYYRSANNTISTGDTPLGTDPVDALVPSGASSESISVSITNAGRYWVGACVDRVSGETTITNNCSTGVQVTVTAPDLLVDTVSVSTSTPEPGASFTFNATVRNSGTAASAATTLRYYRSTDNTITTADTSLGTDPVGALPAGANSPESTTVSITTTGNYWLGACVANVNDEAATDNNCSTGVQVTVTELTVPDLIVDTASVSTSTPEPGASFTFNATVRNSGTAAAAATTLRYYRSTDNTITTADTSLGNDSVGALAPGANSPESTTVSITATGNYWLGACVANVNGETATGNNCSAGVAVTVTAPAQPNLIVHSVTVSTSTPEAGATFTISATTRNRGNQASEATTLRYVRSDDATIDTEDTQLATDPVGELAGDAFLRQSAPVSIAQTGTWWVGACVDSVGDEIAVDNNCSDGVEVTVTAPIVPDLLVDTVSVSTSTPQSGASFTINATVRNSGTAASAATTLRYVRSVDATIDTADTLLATEDVSGLAAGANSQQSASVSISATGTWWVGACVDTVDDETTTDNNCSAGVEVSITAADLLVDLVSVTNATPESGASFMINATVQNSGTAASAATTLHYVLSDDNVIDTSDTELATGSVAGLAIDTSSSHTSAVAIPDPGNYWVGACVDTVSGEINTNNNCSSAVQVTVTAPAADDDVLAAIQLIIQLLLLP